MKTATILCLLGTSVFARAADPYEALLEAKLELASLRARYTERHPKVVESSARVDALSRPEAPVPSPAHLALLQRHINKISLQDAELGLRFTAKHPRRVALAGRLAALRQELQHAGQTLEH